KSSDTALTQNNIWISVCDYVLGRHQQFLDRTAQAALQHHRPIRFTERLQQREVLHVPRADLQNVRIFGNHFNIAVAHYFSDDADAGFLLRFREQTKTLGLHTLKIVRRGSRLKSAAAQKLRTMAQDETRGFENLRFTFHRTRAGHHDEFIAANFDSVNANLRFYRPEFAADKF